MLCLSTLGKPGAVLFLFLDLDFYWSLLHEVSFLQRESCWSLIKLWWRSNRQPPMLELNLPFRFLKFPQGSIRNQEFFVHQWGESSQNVMQYVVSYWLVGWVKELDQPFLGFWSVWINSRLKNYVFLFFVFVCLFFFLTTFLPHRDDINRAYRKLAVLIHPDKSLAPGSEDAFKALVNARAALLQSHRWY